MRELTQLSLTIHISLFFTKFLIMDIAPTMRRKEKRDISIDWVDQETLETIYASVHYDNLDYTLTNMGSFST